MRIKSYLSLTFLIILLSLPTLFYIPTMAQEKSATVTSFYVFFYISLLLLPMAVIKPRIFAYLSVPFLLLMPLELIHVINYDGFSTLAAIVSSIETDPREAIEFTNNYRPYFYIFYPLVLVAIVANLQYLKADYKLTKLTRIGIALCFIVALSAFTIKTVYDLYDSNNDNISKGLDQLYLRLFHQNFPYSYFLKGYEYWKQMSVMADELDKRKNFVFGAKTDRQELQHMKPVVVLVIGETSRAYNWQLNGYGRATNPYLAARKHLVYFTDAISAATHTTQTLSLVLTRATPLNINPFYTEKSIVTAFHEAGFKTIWISNQNMVSGVESTLYATTLEADERIFTNTDYEVDPKMDGVLVPLLKKALSDNQMHPLFIVVHTLGSHEVYRKRYPADFRIFKPDSQSDDYNFASPGIRERLINSYDNSILYTDFVLDRIIDTVADSGRTATVTYFSDHGENILDNGSSRFGHGGVIPTLYVTDVPIFVWVSEKFRTYFPEKYNNLKMNASKPVSNLYLFDTLLDLGGIEIGGNVGEQSLAREHSFPNHRYVLTSGYLPRLYDEIKKTAKNGDTY
jgi:glucan phosphoethanolaminetransferase (alkaline phosphatase superfamily)